jgi:hypothetical protein
MVNLDTSLSRTFSWRELLKVQARADFFNVANKPNYRLVGRLINVPATYGRVLNQFDPRQIQFAVKLLF